MDRMETDGQAATQRPDASPLDDNLRTAHRHGEQWQRVAGEPVRGLTAADKRWLWGITAALAVIWGLALWGSGYLG